MNQRAHRSVEAFFSTTSSDPKMHLDISCSGLHRVPVFPEESCAIGINYFESVEELATADFRPCRVCALEYTLDAVFRKHAADSKVFATFSSQPSFAADVRRFVKMNISDSGKARLLRIAARAGLCVTETSAGPVAYGFVPTGAVPALAQNLRTQTTEMLWTLPEEFFIRTFWALITTNPPELVTDVPYDPWQGAALVS